MARPGIEVSGWDMRWTGEDLAETYEELGKIEVLVEGPAGDEPSQEGGSVELVAALEGRDECEVPRAAGPAPLAARAPPTEAETFAVMPELELLGALADYGRADAARDEEAETSREGALLAA